MTENNIMTNFKGSGKEIDVLNSVLKELLMADEETLDLRTEIKEPKEILLIEEWGNFAKALGLEKTSSLLFFYVRKYKRLMFSLDRKSRGELVEAIKAVIDRDSKEMKMTNPMAEIQK
jgi:hypothetical protein